VPPIAPIEERRELRRRILQLALPLAGANLAQTALSVADTAMIGRLGSRELAAMGPPNVFFLVLFLMASATYMGVQSLTSRRFGQQRFEDCGRILDNGLFLSTLIGVGTGIVGLWLAPWFCSLLIEDPEIAALSSDYLVVRWAGVITLTTLWVMKGFYFGIGITRLDLWVATSMNLINIGLNWLLLYGHWGAPRLGLAGAATSSVVATGLAALVYILHASRPALRNRFGHFRWSSLEFRQLRAILRLSAPRAMAGLAFGGAILYFKLIAEHASEAGLAASTVIWRFMGVSVLASLAIGSAAASLVGQELGRERPDRAELGAREAVRLGAILNIGLGILVIAFPRLVMRFFTEDDAVITAGAPALRLVACFLCVDSGGIILSRVLSAAGCVVYVMTMEFIVSMGLTLGAALILVPRFPDNLAAIWITWVVYMVSWYFAMASKFAAGGWKRVQI
jgi:putative MATE family efflux protein